RSAKENQVGSLIGPQRGSTPAGPLRSRNFTKRSRSDVDDFVGHSHPRTLTQFGPLDFTGAQRFYDIEAVLATNATDPGANIIQLADTTFAIAEVVVPRGGRLISATFIASGGIVADNTNFVTFTVTNKLGAGSGSTAMLAATQDTKAANLNGLTSLVPKALNISMTAAA